MNSTKIMPKRETLLIFNMFGCLLIGMITGYLSGAIFKEYMHKTALALMIVGVIIIIAINILYLDKK